MSQVSKETLYSKDNKTIVKQNKASNTVTYRFRILPINF
ncbi:hypothetical protein STAHO0001_1386 [Staphylococcus hominis SK119]|nr:hypothetical protein STAHO0001_1386 [Staphylococcus hominis SK119]EHR86533.1 hypothetical protein SEVCU122_0872 [Staphylococcus hominis VCU122]